MPSFGFVIIKIVFKVVYLWVFEKDINTDTLVSSIFEIEWSPKSGIVKSYPNTTKAGWLIVALEKIIEEWMLLLGGKV